MTIGYSPDIEDRKKKVPIRDRIDDGLEHKALVAIAHSHADNLYTNNIGHISEELENELEQLCKEYPKEIAIEWNGYCRPDIRWVLKQLMNSPLKLFNPNGEKFRYHHVNKKAESLAERHNLPLITNTDLHARDKQALNSMGRARIIVDVQGETPKDILYSMKSNIFSEKYDNVDKYVSLFHIFGVFGLPLMFSKLYNKPQS